VALEGTGVVRLWDVAAGRSTAAVRLERHIRVEALAVSPDGRTIAAGGYTSHAMFGLIALVETDGVELTPWKPKP